MSVAPESNTPKAGLQSKVGLQSTAVFQNFAVAGCRGIGSTTSSRHEIELVCDLMLLRVLDVFIRLRPRA